MKREQHLKTILKVNTEIHMQTETEGGGCRKGEGIKSRKKRERERLSKCICCSIKSDGIII